MKRTTRTKNSVANGPITIKHVATEAEVSTATVSRVLSGLNGVTNAVRNRVTSAVEKLDYHPNRMARGLRIGHRKVIGMIIPDLQNPFFTGVVHGAEGALYEAGYTLQLGNSGGLAERESEQLETLRGEGVAGLLLIPGNKPGANYESVRAWKIPVVAIDRSPGDLKVDMVCCNNREGVRQAVNHLISLRYKEIALLNGPEGINVTIERLGGYLETLRGAGIPVLESFIIHSDFRQNGGYEAMKRFLDMAKPPRAIVIANNLMTLGALQAIHERGVSIPEELAVVCYDDMPWAISLRPPLTAVSQPAEDIGRTATQLLLERLNDPNRPVRQVVLNTHLEVRSSCGATVSGLRGLSGAEASARPAKVIRRTASDSVDKKASILAN